MPLVKQVKLGRKKLAPGLFQIVNKLRNFHLVAYLIDFLTRGQEHKDNLLRKIMQYEI